MQQEVVSTLTGQVRGLDQEHMLGRDAQIELYKTHIVFNDLIRHACDTLLALKAGKYSREISDSLLLKGFVESVLQLRANEANWALTRLFTPEGETNGARKSFEKLAAKIEKEKISELKQQQAAISTVEFQALPSQKELLQRGIDAETARKLARFRRYNSRIPAEKQRTELAKLLGPASEQILALMQTTREQEAARRQAVIAEIQGRFESQSTDCANAIKCLDKIKSEGWAPLTDFTLTERRNERMEGCWHFADLDTKWQRQILQQAVEHLKSHFALQENHQAELREWQLLKDRVSSVPRVREYLVVRPLLQAEFEGVSPAKANPLDVCCFLQAHGKELLSFRNPEAGEKFVLDDSLLKLAKALATKPADQIQRATASWHRQLKHLCPAWAALLKIHKDYESCRAKPPKPPTLTLPDIDEHPRYVIWSAAQRSVEIAPLASAGQKRFWVETTVPLLAPGTVGLHISQRKISISLDPRVRELSFVRSGKNLVVNRTDPLTGQKLPVKLGAIRLMLEKDHTQAGLTRYKFKPILTLKRSKAPLPEWCGQYLNSVRVHDQPVFPKKMVVCAFCLDPENFGVLRTADIIDGNLSFRKRQPFSLDNVPRAADTLEDRRKIARSSRRIAKYELRLATEQLDPADQMQLERNIREEDKYIKKRYQHITNSSTDRANKIAHRLMIEVEKLRTENPDSEVVLLLEYQADRKPRKAWGKELTRLLSSAAGGKVIDKIKALAADRPASVPIISLETHALWCAPPYGQKGMVIPYRVVKDHHERRIEYDAGSPLLACICQGDSGTIKIERWDRKQLEAANLIGRFIEPDYIRDLELDELKLEQEKTFRETPEISAQLLKLHFPIS